MSAMTTDQHRIDRTPKSRDYRSGYQAGWMQGRASASKPVQRCAIRACRGFPTDSVHLRLEECPGSQKREGCPYPFTHHPFEASR
jgi:hypothetical protein